MSILGLNALATGAAAPLTPRKLNLLIYGNQRGTRYERALARAGEEHTPASLSRSSSAESLDDLDRLVSTGDTETVGMDGNDSDEASSCAAAAAARHINGLPPPLETAFRVPLSSGDARLDSPEALNPTKTVKILVVGNAKCGKTSIINRFVNNKFDAAYRSTVGADYIKKDLTVPGGCIRLQLWDIAGQDRFAKLTRAYFQRAKGAVIVCDVTRLGTFDAVGQWKQEIDSWCQTEGCALPIYLVVNKCDLLEGGQASFEAGAAIEKCCNEHGFAGWYLTSAKDGQNIGLAMTNLATKVLESAADDGAQKKPYSEGQQPFRLDDRQFGERGARPSCCSSG